MLGSLFLCPKVSRAPVSLGAEEACPKHVGSSQWISRRAAASNPSCRMRTETSSSDNTTANTCKRKEAVQ